MQLEDLKCKRNKEKEANKSPNISKSNLAVNKSNKYLIKRFNEDFIQALKKKSINKNKISYHKTEEILKELGFISNNNCTGENEEKVLFVDLWGCLRGDMHKGVDKNNLKIFLGAIQGLRIEISSKISQKSSELNPYLAPQMPEIIHEEAKCESNMSNTSNPETSRRQVDSKDKCSDSHDTSKFLWFEAGYFDDNEILQLTDKEIKRWQKYFILFSRNRSKYLKEMKTQQNHKRNKFEEFTYKPKICK